MVELKVVLYQFKFKGEPRWMVALVNKRGREKFYGGISFKDYVDAMEFFKHYFEDIKYLKELSEAMKGN